LWAKSVWRVRCAAHSTARHWIQQTVTSRSFSGPLSGPGPYRLVCECSVARCESIVARSGNHDAQRGQTKWLADPLAGALCVPKYPLPPHRKQLSFSPRHVHSLLASNPTSLTVYQRWFGGVGLVLGSMLRRQPQSKRQPEYVRSVAAPRNQNRNPGLQLPPTLRWLEPDPSRRSRSL